MNTSEYLELSIITACEVAVNTQKVEEFLIAVCWLARYDHSSRNTSFEMLEDMEKYRLMPYPVEYLYHSWKSDTFLIHRYFLEREWNRPIKTSNQL